MFHLINLPYPIDALEPVISARTLEFHYGKHLQGYVDNLNKLIAGTDYESMSLKQIVISSAAAGGVEKSKAVFNNAGQILNHNLYFTQFRPSTVISGEDTGHPSVISSVGAAEVEKSIIITKIINQWGSLDAFKNEFVSKGTSLFGSGWVWLQAEASGALSIAQYLGADNPVAHSFHPLLTFDVWEHAYYLDYQNRRAAHLEALWEIVDWGVVEERFSR